MAAYSFLFGLLLLTPCDPAVEFCHRTTLRLSIGMMERDEVVQGVIRQRQFQFPLQQVSDVAINIHVCLSSCRLFSFLFIFSSSLPFPLPEKVLLDVPRLVVVDV